MISARKRIVRIIFQSFSKNNFSNDKLNQYEILNVKETASFKQIKKAFLDLSKIYHPDYYKGTQTNKYHQIQTAFKMIYSPKSRRQVDLKLGIKNSLWEDQNLKVSSKEFNNQQFQQLLKTQLGLRTFKTLEERLQQGFKQQINKQINILQVMKIMLIPFTIFSLIWVGYNTLEQLLISYQGQQEHKIQIYQSKKKFSAVPINMR